MTDELFVAGLDVWAPAVRGVMREVAPAHFDLHFATSHEDEEQLALFRQADPILTGGGEATRARLQQAKKLRFIHRWGVGYDRIDVGP